MRRPTSAVRASLGVLPACVIAAAVLGLAGVAWAMSNPPGSAPDELAHYTKAIGVAGGDPAGAPPRRGPASLSALEGVAPDRAARLLEELARAGASPGTVWQAKTTRVFSVPSDLAVRLRCSPGLGAGSLDCLSPLQATRPSGPSRSYVGTYQPFSYVVPGAAARAMSSPEWGVRIARLAGLSLCVVLLALAVGLTWAGPGGPLALAALMAAVTPAALFAAASINPSGLEIAAGLCFAAALLAAARLDDAGRRGAWIAAGVSGVVLASCRSFGPLFVPFVALAVAAVAGGPGVRRALGASPALLAAVAVAIVVAAAANWAWEFTWQPHPGLSADDVGPGVDDAWSKLPGLGQQAVGVLGSLYVVLPEWVYEGWGLLMLLILGVAFWLGTARERVVLAGLIVALLAVVFALSVAVQPTGFGVQSRYLLPVLVLLPLAAGEITRRHRERLSAGMTRSYVITVGAVVAALHARAWYENATESARRSGFDLLTASERFKPPGGWWPWALLMAAGAAGTLAAAIMATRRPQSAASGPPGAEPWAEDARTPAPGG